MANVIDLSTEDDLQYHFYPVSSGSVQFRVRAAHDAHIALTTTPQESDPMVEVFLGGWSNSKSVIRKNRQKPDVVEIETPGILSDSEVRGFWVRWDGGIISAGREGEAVPFISWADPEPFPIQFVGVCTGWGATGTWQIEDGAEINTPDKLEYVFGPTAAGSLEFEYRGPHNCHVSLTGTPSETNPMYEFIIGGWENTKSVIRHCQQQPDKVSMPTPGIVNSNEYKKFLIEWRCGRLSIRDRDTGSIIMDWADPTPFPITHFGVRTGWGARGQWRIRHFYKTGVKPLLPSAPQYGGAPPSLSPSGGVWAPCTGGDIPPNAVVGGQDANGETLYVARAQHEGAMLPGKLAKSHGCAYVPWGGQEHAKPQCEVLVGNFGNWVSVNGGAVPPGAFPAGESEEGEPLYIGRVNHEGSVTTGKVQASHGTCYIPFGGQELAFTDYEILMS